MTTLATREQSKAIRKRMQMIRNDLPYAMDDVRDDIRQLADWKYYVRRFPLATVGAAALAAYALVPSKSTSHSHRKSSDNSGETEVAESSFFGGLIGAAATMALRTGAQIALRQATSVIFPAKTNHEISPARRSF